MLCSTFTSAGTFRPTALTVAGSETVRISLKAGALLAFDVGHRDVVLVTLDSGVAWLTEDSVDHLLDCRTGWHACRQGGRVVISALADAIITFRRG